MIWYICTIERSILTSTEMQVQECRTRISHRAKQNGIVSSKLFQPTLGDVATMRLVIFTAPWQVFVVEREAPYSGSKLLEDCDGRTDDFRSNAIAGDGGDLVIRIRGRHSCNPAVAIFCAD